MLSTNYRPVSPLIDTYKILINNQFGFRKAHSSDIALIALMTIEISNAMENGDHAVGISLEFSKASNTEDHCTLFHNLYHYGISDTALEIWFRSYSTERQHYVTYNGTAFSVMWCSPGINIGSTIILDLYC